MTQVSRHLEGQSTMCRSETNDQEQTLKSRGHEPILGSCASTPQNMIFSTHVNLQLSQKQIRVPDVNMGHVSGRMKGQTTQIHLG